MAFFSKTHLSVILWIVSVVLLSGCTTVPETHEGPREDFATRCAGSGVIRCISFEKSELTDHGGVIHWGRADAPVGVFVNGKNPGASLEGRVRIATDHKTSGESSLEFSLPSRSNAGYAGQFYANFADDYSIQFGEGQSFYVQWRQRFSKSFIENRYQPYNSWKQAIVGEGNRSGFKARSCSQLELVVTNKGKGTAYPAMYHSCRGKDGRSEGLFQNAVINYEPDQWMTFQLVVKIGSWYKNDRDYKRDSLVELWVAKEGEASQKVVSQQYDLANTNPQARYGKIWLLPYLSGKNKEQKHPVAHTWYDDLIISTMPVADPSD